MKWLWVLVLLGYHKRLAKAMLTRLFVKEGRNIIRGALTLADFRSLTARVGWNMREVLHMMDAAVAVRWITLSLVLEACLVWRASVQEP